MNERIEKLVAEAFFDETADANDTKIYKLNDAQMQKFAQLIVRECIKICSDVEADEELCGLSDGALVCMAEIKEHFGVEE